MTMLRTIVTTVCGSATVLVVSAALLWHPSASASTLDNLQAAYDGESNANARYLAFAKQADKEGYGEVASLFRAAARAEKIHAINHAAAIQEMGAAPKADVKSPAVKSTRENLEEAIKGETYERDIMYPDFLKQARTDRNTHAIRTLNLAKSAESEHAKLYAVALVHLDQLKGSKSVAFSVCPVCGFTAKETNFADCPSCFTSKNDFEKVA
jgi:rubrerythrin